MRLVGCDLEGAKYLTKGHVNMREFLDRKPATLHRNESEMSYSTLKPLKAENSFATIKTFSVRSLIETDDEYEMMTSEVTLENMKVTDFSITMLEKISDIEAGMMVKREEFTTLGYLEFPPEEFRKDSTFSTRISQETRYGNGRLFMIFNKTNDHVAERVYRIFDDVFGLFYITDGGEILVSSFKKGNLKVLENDAAISLGADKVEFVQRYRFDVPVLYEFANSGFEEFEDFVDVISTGDED